MARRYGTAPSARLAIDDAYLAYCLDDAAMVAGLAAERRAYEAAQHEAEEQASSDTQPQPKRTPPERGATISAADDGLIIRGTVPFIGRRASSA